MGQQGEQFWATVHMKAESLAFHETEADKVSKRDLEKVRDVMLESAQAWAAMGLVSYKTLVFMQGVNAKAQSMMADLPTGKETLSEIQAEADALKTLIDEDEGLSKC